MNRRGNDERERHRRRYGCRGCGRWLDDLSGTVFAGHHQPLKVWVLCLCLMGLNLSNPRIAQELGLNKDDVQAMTTQLREGVVAKASSDQGFLEGVAEADEVYIVAGHKGNPQAVKKKLPRPKATLEGEAGAGHPRRREAAGAGLAPAGRVVIQMLANVRQRTIRPLFDRWVRLRFVVNTDEFVIYDRLPEWGSARRSADHGADEFAKDSDGDGSDETHVNTLEGFWSLLRSWLWPHRGVSEERLPLYLGFFQAVHNLRKRGSPLLGPLLSLLIQPCPRNAY